MTVVVIKLLPLLCLVCIGGQSLQSQIGANHVVKRGFDFSKFQDSLLAEIRRQVPPVIQQKNGTFRYTISNFRISDMQFPKIHTSFAYQQNTMTVKLTLQDAKITGAVDWWFRYIDWITWFKIRVQHTESGHASLSMRKVGFAVTIIFDGKTIRTSHCSSGRSSVRFNIEKGGIGAWIVRLFLWLGNPEEIMEKILDGSNGLICTSVTRLINREGKNIMGLFPSYGNKG